MDKRLIKESIECAKKSAERYRHLAENMQGEGCHRILEDMEKDARQHAECLAEILDEELPQQAIAAAFRKYKK